MLPTLDQFLSQSLLRNSYIRHPKFRQLYIRQGVVPVIIGENFSYCRNVITIANVVAVVPGEGAFTHLVEDLMNKGKAVYVECVHTPYLRDKLLRMGFIQVNEGTGYHYLINHDRYLYNTKKVYISGHPQ